MLANRTGRWSIATALLCVVVLAASWFLLIAPRRADAATVRSEAAESDIQAGQLRLKITELQEQFADLPRQKAMLEAIKVQLPPKAGMPDLIRDLRSFAADSGVSLDSLSPGTPVVLGATGASTAKTGAVVNIQIQIAVTGEYFEAVLFVKELQTQLRRSVLITAVNAAPAQQQTGQATPAPNTTATAAATAVATPAPSATPIDLRRVTMSITTSVFVLMDETTTLEDVTRQVRDAAARAGTTVPSTPTSAPAPTATS
jgi:type IV pilus assembly protein PilO